MILTVDRNLEVEVVENINSQTLVGSAYKGYCVIFSIDETGIYQVKNIEKLGRRYNFSLDRIK